MKRRHLIAAAAGTAAWPAAAQAFPTRPVTITVPYPPGGPTDTMARALAEILSGRLGQPVIVENRPGAGGQIAGTAVLRRQPDGYSLLIGDFSTLGINRTLYRNFAYDPLTEVAPIAPLLVMPHALFVPQASPFATLGGLVATGRARPLNFASQGVGTVGHLLGETLQRRAGIALNHVPYQGSAPAMTALLGGQVDLLFDGIGAGLQHVRAGGLRVLAVTGPERLPVVPEVPTAAEAGQPALSMAMWFGVVTAAGVPPPILRQLHGAVAEAADEPRFGERFVGLGFQPMRMSSEAFAAFIRSEAERAAAILRENRIVLE